MSDKLSFIRRVVPEKVSQTVGRQLLVVSKNSPHILFGVGLVGFVGTTILASRAALRVNSIVDEARSDLDDVDTLVRDVDLAARNNYTDKEAGRDRFYIYSRTAIDLGRLYLPTVFVGGVSIFCLSKAHGILTDRNATLTAAYVGLDRAFSEYRKRVEEELGADRERDIYYDASPITVSSDNETKELKVVGDRAYSRYARFFDELCEPWQKVPEYNLIYLRAQQAYANNMLRSRGHVFLNEVYDALGIPRSQEGSIVGWVIGGGDDYIDFGFMNGETQRIRDFVNGREGAILLDFNVDGLIYNKI